MSAADTVLFERSDESCIRSQFDPFAVPDPAPGLEPFASARVYDNGFPIDQGVTWDSNADGKLVVEYRGASGPDVCHMRVVVQRSLWTPPHGIAAYASGDLLSAGVATNPKILVEVFPPMGTTVSVYVGGMIEDPAVIAADIAVFSGWSLTLEDVLPETALAAIIEAAQRNGRYFTDPAGAAASPVDPRWSPQGGLSGLTVIGAPPGSTVKVASNTVLNSAASPGMLLVVGGASLEWVGNGDYYGLVFCSGELELSVGNPRLHGMALTASTMSLNGAGQILYNHECIANLAHPTAVDPLPDTHEWLDITPPVTTPSGADEAWHAETVTLSFSAEDEFGGSGIDYTEYRLDAGDWATGDSLTVSDEGTHLVSYRSVDRAGNVEEAQSLTVSIDSTPPIATDSDDGLWHRGGYVVSLTTEDADSGMSGGLARVEYSRDSGQTWQEGSEVVFRTWKRGGGSGEHELLYRATDFAGNVSAPVSTLVRIDARPPLTHDDAPFTPQASDVTVHLTAADSLFGVTACSGVNETRHSLDGGAWLQGTSVLVSGSGLHWIAYYSTDNAGNAEYVKSCSVTIASAAPAKRPTRRPERR